VLASGRLILGTGLTHDPANLDPILNVVAGFFVAWILFAVLGAFYLAVKWSLRWPFLWKEPSRDSTSRPPRG
jgi:hypothetical protein